MRGQRMAVLIALAAVLAPHVGWCEAQSAGEPEPFRYNAGGRRDPFVPLGVGGRLVAAAAGARGDFGKPVLYGIMWDPNGRSIALINDGEYQRGDTVNGYQITEIRQDAVVLESDGEEKPLVLQIAFESPAGAPGSSSDSTKGGQRR